jgi:hypothetical protein
MSNESDVIERLVDAHVAFELERLQPSRLPELIEREVNALFVWSGKVKLDDLVTREQINSVIDRYAIDLKISGAFTELAGEMSRLVVSSRLSEHTRVDEVLEPGAFSQFADKLTGLEQLWRELLHLVVRSDAYATLLSSTLQRGVLDALFRGTDDPAHRTFIDTMLGRLRPLVARRIEPYLTVYLEKLIKQSVRHTEKRLPMALDIDAVRGLVDEVWDQIAPMRLSEAFAFVSAHDLEDFVVLGYEFWQRYRRTRYFRGISHEMVDHFFTKYGAESLLALLDELEVSAPMVISELQVFLPSLLEHAQTTDFLEQRIRAHLRSFYRSDAAAAILASFLAGERSRA